MRKITRNLIVGASLAVLGASAFLGMTHSKYINKITGNGETEIAKWHFEVNDATEQMETIKLAETYDENTLINGKIAPRNKWQF